MSGRIMLDAEERHATAQRPQEPPPSPEPAPPAPAAAAPEPPERPQEAPREAPELADEPAAPETPPAEPQDDFQKRLARENREKWEARREAEQLRQRVAEYERQRAQGSAPPNEAMERARQEVRLENQQTEFNRQCNEVFRKGQAEYPDFSEAVQSLNAVGWGNRPDALAMLTSLPEAHRVYRELASNLDNAGRILTLGPMQMAMELARMAHVHAASGGPPPNPPPAPAQGTPQGAQPLPPITQAPAPIRPVGGTTRAPERPLDKVSMAEFIRRRDREESMSQRIRR